MPCTATEATAQAILDRGGDYCLALKGQPAGAARLRFGCCWTIREAEASDRLRDHRRRPRPHRDPPCRWSCTRSPGWPKAMAFRASQAVGKVTATREVDGHSHDRRPATICCPRRSPRRAFAQVVRTHWHIENRLHWVLDVVMDEDQTQCPQGPRAGKPRAPAPLRPQPAARRPATRARPAASSNAPPGTTLSSSKSSPPPNAGPGKPGLAVLDRRRAGRRVCMLVISHAPAQADRDRQLEDERPARRRGRAGPGALRAREPPRPPGARSGSARRRRC